MNIYEATIGKLVTAVKDYCKAQDERAAINKRLAEEDNIRNAFYIHREATGNYYLMCNEVYIEAFGAETRIAEIEARRDEAVETSLECYRKEH